MTQLSAKTEPEECNYPTAPIDKERSSDNTVYMILRAKVHAAYDCWHFVVRSSDWSPYRRPVSSTRTAAHSTGADPLSPPRALPAPRTSATVCAQPAHSTSTGTGTRSPPRAQPPAPCLHHVHSLQHQHRHPAPSTSLSPPRAQPAHSTSTGTQHQHRQPVLKERAGNSDSLLFEVRTP